jgi:hypothetical protein
MLLSVGECKRYASWAIALSLAIVVGISGCKKSAEASAAARPETFATQEEAAEAVYKAAQAGDSGVLVKIFGSDAKELLFSGDPVEDKAAKDHFIKAYDQMHRWEKLRNGELVLALGAENYPFPFKLTKNSTGRWYFDGNSAKNEILARRIGQNELTTIDVLNAIVDAQAEYFDEVHDGSQTHQYAQKFISEEGKRNGLYWKQVEGEPESPLGPLAANASTEGYKVQNLKPQPFHGYFYRILARQGSHAPGGTKEYVVNGVMTDGFAILAYPAEYLNSGVVSFMVNQDGTVFEKDLGEDTAKVARELTDFDPDDTWKAEEE